MFVPSASGDLLSPTSTATAGPGVINSTAITTTNNSSMNALTMFLFWFFLCSTGVLVVASVVFLRRLKQRDTNKAGKADKAGKDTSKNGKAAPAAGKEMDEESSIGGSTILLAHVEHTLTGSTRAGSA
ncbi:hypothetical protein SCUCBS95973_004422 [Sporothrix curviconia]|uniref:Uncharacterized protein n=1 Tax=Sporothrix curviconia TaxID=1260050 RepID=A0ABP0BQ39_9PEZI